MARNENPPFARGETYYNGGTIDTNDLGGVNLEGMVWLFEDINIGATGVGAKPQRSGRPVKCICVRNVSGIPLLPKRLATFQKTGVDGKFYLGRVDGYATLTSDRGYPIDEFLPPAGVPNNDLFWLVIEGPAMVLTDIAPLTSIAVGDNLVSLTAATSQATTAGRVAPQDLTGATAVLGKQIMNLLGRALSAVTTGNTNSNLLCDVGEW